MTHWSPEEAERTGEEWLQNRWNEGAAIAFGLMGMAQAIAAQHLCRCNEWYAWCPAHDTCPRCCELLSVPSPGGGEK